MTDLVLYSTQQSFLADVIIWSGLAIIFLILLALIRYQYLTSKSLTYELSQLDKVKKNNVEYEFVLKTMRLSTWHIDTKTREITFDNDFRDKGDTYVPPTGGTTADLGATMSEQDRQRLVKIIDDLCEGRVEEAHMEYQIQLPNPKKYYWSESYAIVAERDAEGRPKRIVGTSARIDERKAMEKALVEARNRAEESDRLKSAFIANMSHEIRTPLNAIVGFTSILPDVKEEEERKMMLDLVHENTQKLLRIVDDIVNISKVEAGKEEIVLSAFDLTITLNELADQYKPNLKPNVELVKEFAVSSQNIMTDHNRLTEIIKHLLSNATKFTNNGSVTIGFEEPANGRIRIFVKDTGIGIAPENQERVFERFFKVDEFVPGAGLGLSICRTMAYSLGGNVTVDSKRGEGSTFVLEIPIQ